MSAFAPAKGRLPLLALATFASNMGLGIVFPLVPHLAAGSQAGAAAVGGIFAAYAAALVISEVVAGALADSREPAQVLACGLGLYMVSLLLFAVARGVPALIAVRALEGAGVGLVIPSVMALLVRGQPPERLGRAMAAVMGAGGVGFVVGPLLGAWLAPVGLALPFLAAAGVAGLAACWAASLPAGTREREDAGLGGLARGELAAFVARLTDPGFWRLVLPLFAVKALFATLQALLPLFGEQVLGADLAHISYLFVITAVAYALAVPLAGRLTDRFGARRPLLGAFGLMAPLLAVLAAQTRYGPFMLPFGLFCLLQCACVVLALAHLAEGLGSTAPGRALGLASAVGDLGMVTAPLALMPLYAWRPEAVFWGLGGLLALVLLLLALGGPHRPLAA